MQAAVLSELAVKTVENFRDGPPTKAQDLLEGRPGTPGNSHLYYTELDTTVAVGIHFGSEGGSDSPPSQLLELVLPDLSYLDAGAVPSR